MDFIDKTAQPTAPVTEEIEDAKVRQDFGCRPVCPGCEHGHGVGTALSLLR
jgi:hypothetical protein